jgi:3-oxoacyl-[acyl-carrier protein] reductase
MHGTWDQVGVEALERYFRVYVSAALSLAQAMQVDWSQTHWGRVVLLGTAAQIGAPPPQLLAYVTAKSALEGLCKALAVEVGVLGVTVNLVAPGMTPTALVQHVPPRARMLEAQRTPLRRLATPADTAELVAFLMSDSGAFISGAQIPVTGGLSMS